MNRPHLRGPERVMVFSGGGLLLIGVLGYAWSRFGKEGVSAGFQAAVTHWPSSLLLAGALTVLLALLNQVRYGLGRAGGYLFVLASNIVSSVRRSRFASAVIVTLLALAILFVLVDAPDRLDALKTFIWPAIVLTIALLFRAPFTNLINQIEQAEGWGVRISRQADDVRRLSESISTPDHSSTLHNDSGKDSQRDPAPVGTEEDRGEELTLHDGYAQVSDDYFKLNPDEADPALVILARWEGIRERADSLAEDFPTLFGPTIRRRAPVDPGAVTRWLATHGVVPAEFVELVASLRHIRNEVAHARRVPVASSAAWSYDVAARKVVDSLDRSRALIPAVIYQQEVLRAIRRVGGLSILDQESAADSGADVRVKTKNGLFGVQIKWSSQTATRMKHFARDAENVRLSPEDRGLVVVTNSQLAPDTQEDTQVQPRRGRLTVVTWASKDDDAALLAAFSGLND